MNPRMSPVDAGVPDEAIAGPERVVSCANKAEVPLPHERPDRLHVLTSTENAPPTLPMSPHLVADDYALYWNVAALCQNERPGYETGAGAGPDGAVVGPPGVAEGVGPDSNACEVMCLAESGNIIW